MMSCVVGGVLCALGAVALVKLLVRGFGFRHYRRMGCGPHGFGGGCGPRGFSPWHGGPWHGGPWHDGSGRGRWGEDDERGDDVDGYGPPWRGRGGRGRGFRKFGWLFQELGTTPEQERVLIETFGELKHAGSKIAGKVAASRGEWADALEAESFDETMVGSAVAGLEQAVEDARKSSIDAFAKVHATLDAEQRKRLASWLRRRGGFGGFRGGPYRSVL